MEVDIKFGRAGKGRRIKNEIVDSWPLARDNILGMEEAGALTGRGNEEK